MTLISKITNRLRYDASRILDAAARSISLKPQGDGWNGLTALNPLTVLDIGACGGELAERELAKVFPQAVIHCFEPHPTNFARLAKVAARHPRIVAHEMALGATEGSATMQFNPGSPSSSSLRHQTLRSVELFPRLDSTVETSVRQRRLDDWAASLDRPLADPLVIKMDVQGFEDQVIAGGRETLRRAQGVVLEICLEPLYEGQPSFAQLHDVMTGLGFDFCGTRDQYFGTGGEVIYLDACFMRRTG